MTVPEGMYIATYDKWRSGQILSVQGGEEVTFLEDSYDLETGP